MAARFNSGESVDKIKILLVPIHLNKFIFSMDDQLVVTCRRIVN